jgi:DNA-binding NarL/FixJ family response regulator
MIHLAIADNQKLFRQALCTLIAQEQGLCLNIQAENGPELLQLLENAQKLPDVVLMNTDSLEINGIELNHQLQKYFPSIKVIILSLNPQPGLISRMIEEGLGGYLIKNCDKDELINAINIVYRSVFYTNLHTIQATQCSSVFKNVQNMKRGEIRWALTKREKQILDLICMELSTAQIADKLFLSSRTIEGHRKHLLSKTKSHNTVGLVLFAVKNGLLNLGQ